MAAKEVNKAAKSQGETAKKKKPPEVKGRGRHPRSLEALKASQFQPGQSGNPAGTPPGYKQFKTRFKELMARIAPELFAEHPNVRMFFAGDRKDITNQDVFDAILFFKAVNNGGSIDAMREVLDRLEGKAVQPMEHSGPEGGPIQTEQLQSLTTDDLIKLREINRKLNAAV